MCLLEINSSPISRQRGGDGIAPKMKHQSDPSVCFKEHLGAFCLEFWNKTGRGGVRPGEHQGGFAQLGTKLCLSACFPQGQQAGHCLLRTPCPHHHPRGQPGGSATGSHAATTLGSHCCSAREVRTQQPFTQIAEEQGKLCSLGRRQRCRLGDALRQARQASSAGWAGGRVLQLLVVGCSWSALGGVV